MNKKKGRVGERAREGERTKEKIMWRSERIQILNGQHCLKSNGASKMKLGRKEGEKNGISRFKSDEERKMNYTSNRETIEQ